MFSKKILLAAIVLTSFSCKKETVTFDTTPTLEYLSITPSIAHQYTDKVVITVKYTDGDGDLGENTTGVKNCFVRDNRIGIVYEYRIQQLGPDAATIPITGNLNIEIGGQGITDGSSSQSASYTVYLKDRAGHQSNSVTTGNITIQQ
jgi:hypothetical protein